MYGEILTLANLRTFKENFGEFTCLTYRYTLAKESGIWLGKISVNDICFAKIHQSFPMPEFCACYMVPMAS